MAEERPLRLALHHLRNAAPEEFDKVVEIFDVYKNDQVLAAAMAPQGDVLTVQGHARQCIALARMLRESDNPPASR